MARENFQRSLADARSLVLFSGSWLEFSQLLRSPPAMGGRCQVSRDSDGNRQLPARSTGNGGAGLADRYVDRWAANARRGFGRGAGLGEVGGLGNGDWPRPERGCRRTGPANPGGACRLAIP